MEPKLIRKDINYQKKILVMVSVLVISLFIGGSFALLSSSSEIEKAVTFSTGNFDLEVTTTGALSLDREVPKSYDDGFKSNDITLTLTNTGSLEIGKYEVKLEGDTGTNLEANYIRYSVSEDDGKTYLASKLLSETNNIIYTGYSLKTSKVLKVKLWIDEAAGEAVLKKTYNGKINVELYQNEDTLVDVVKSKLVSNYSGSNESFEGGLVGVNTNGDLYHEEKAPEIREYRYSGSNVNNYVTFNDEVWRIIGVFKDENNIEHVKIVRNEVLNGIFPKEYTINEKTYNIKGSTDKYAYWSNKDEYNNNWEVAGIKYWLNSEKDDTINKGYLSYLIEGSINMIENVNYYLGTVIVSSNGDTTINSYFHEREIDNCMNLVNENPTNGCRVWNNNNENGYWKGMIGLLYPSDYGYTSLSSYWNNQTLNNFDVAADTSWIKITANHLRPEHLISPSNDKDKLIVGFSHTYIIQNFDANSEAEIRPCLYLKSNVKITGGTGEQNNPYTLELN